MKLFLTSNPQLKAQLGEPQDTKINLLLDLMMVKRWSTTLLSEPYRGNVNGATIPDTVRSLFVTHPKVTAIYGNVEENFRKRAIPDHEITYIKNLFEQVRTSALHIVERLPLGAQKENLKSKIKSLTFSTKLCTKDLTYYGASEGTDGVVEYCLNNLFSSTSLFSKIQILAHEIGHTVNPGSSSIFPMGNLVQCLKSDASAKASGAQVNETFCDCLRRKCWLIYQRQCLFP